MVKKETKEPAKFAEGLGYQKLSIIFIIACIFGDLYEIILNFFFHFFGNNGEIFIERRSAVIYGPFSVIYGFGAILMAKALAEKNLKWWQIFIRGALICGIAEIILGYLQIFFTGTSSWNYSDHWLSFANNLSSPRIIILWGIIAVIFVKFVYPLICKLTDKIPAKTGAKVLNIIMVLLAIDMIISLSAVIRWNFRHEGKQPITPYGQFLDNVYPDNFMKEAYPNMEFIER